MNYKEFSKRYRQLQAKLVAYQHKRACSLVKSRVFLRIVKDFRIQFLKDGSPPQGFLDVEQRDKWVTSLSPDKQKQFDLKLKRLIITALVKCAYSEKWSAFVENYALYGQTISPPVRDCDDTRTLLPGSELWTFSITGVNAIPSRIELDLIKLQLDWAFQSVRSNYYTRTDLIESEIRKMEAERLDYRSWKTLRRRLLKEGKINGKTIYSLGPIDYKGLQTFLKTQYGIETTVANLEKINTRSKTGQKLAKSVKRA